MLRISQIKLSINEDISLLLKKIIKKLNIKKSDLISYCIHKESIDARKKDIQFVYTVDIDVKDEQAVLKNIRSSQVMQVSTKEYPYVQTGSKPIKGRPVIIGFGPSGMFAALILCEMGYKPLIIERGKAVEERIKDVERFWKEGLLDENSNVQFGEGGAGTFSDGKLTTRIKDSLRCKKVLNAFISAGAPDDILYKQKPHLGTDLLRNIVRNIRERVIELGGEIRFNSKMTDIIVQNEQVDAVVVNGKETIKTNAVILALGHSARDTFEMLVKRQVHIEQKPFSIGVRIEHPQHMIDKVQYGKYAGHPRLGAADYKLVYHCKNGRGVYTFCMCPGGVVVASASEKSGVVTNGMSYYKRDGENANSALLVDVKPSDFDSEEPLAGIEFQRKWERKAFKAAGYYAPAQRVEDFLKERPSKNQGSIAPTYKPGVFWTDITKYLPQFVTEAMKEAIPRLAKKLEGFDMNDAVMTAVETRSSSPIRIKRDKMFQSNIGGMFPTGEGAGYAGGIISAAVDGIKAAEAVASIYKPMI